MRRIEKHEAALRDLDDAFVYLYLNAWPELAEKFLKNAEKSFAMLAEFPHMGSPVGERQGRQLRKFPIKGFEEHLIFYITPEDRVVVVRVLNESQEWYRELEVGFDLDEPEQ
jgi:toxin ParE1/3/4